MEKVYLMHVSQVKIRESLTHDAKAAWHYGQAPNESRKLLMTRNKKNLSQKQQTQNS